MSRNTYDRTKWYTINDEKLQEALGCTTGQSVPLEGTPGPHHEEDTVSPSLEEEKREKKEPEGEIALGVEDEDRLAQNPQVETVDTPPADAAPPRPVDEPEATDTRAIQVEPTEKQQACPHPFAEVITLTGGITICNHCFGLVAFDPLADAA
jgi:hypothetical protein